MCIEDIYIARHSYATLRGSMASVINLPANAKRLAIVLSSTYDGYITDATGTKIIEWTSALIGSSYNTTSTNNAIPTANTGTITVQSGSRLQPGIVLTVAQYGALLQGPLSFPATSSTTNVYEVEMDADLEARLVAMEGGGWR